MLDIKFVRENPEVVKQNIRNKFQDSKLELVDKVLELDKENREIKQEVEALRAERNKISKQIGALMGQGKREEAEEVKKQVAASGTRIEELSHYNKNNIDELMDGVLADTRAMNDWGSSMAKPAYDYIIREGQPVGTIQGFKSEGYYTIDDFTYADGKYTLKPGVPDIQGIVNYPDGVKVLAADGQTAVPGMPKFADTTGDGVVDEDDKTIIGEAMPQHTGGFTINGNWKAIDFSVGFTYQIGGDVYNANAMHSLMGNKDNSAGQNRLKFVSETFKYYDVDTNGDLMLVKDPTALAALNANTNYSSFFSEYGIVSSKFIEDASYLRLNTLTVGYTFPKNWMNKIGLQNARVYFTGSNLFCIDGYSGIDPDVNTKTDGKDGFPTPYFDYQSYPKARTYTFGVNLTF